MHQSNVLCDLGNRIRWRRRFRDMSQSELARHIRKSKQLVSAIERGKVDVSYSNLITICQALDCSLIGLLRN